MFKFIQCFGVILTISFMVSFIIFNISNTVNTKEIWSTAIVISKDNTTQSITVQSKTEIFVIHLNDKTLYDIITIRDGVNLLYTYNLNTHSKRNVRINPSCDIIK